MSFMISSRIKDPDLIKMIQASPMSHSELITTALDQYFSKVFSNPSNPDDFIDVA